MRLSVNGSLHLATQVGIRELGNVIDAVGSALHGIALLKLVYIATALHTKVLEHLGRRLGGKNAEVEKARGLNHAIGEIALLHPHDNLLRHRRRLHDGIDNTPVVLVRNARRKDIQSMS